MTARDDEPAPLAPSARRLVDAARPFERLSTSRKDRLRGRILTAVGTGASLAALAETASASVSKTASAGAASASTQATIAASGGASSGLASGGALLAPAVVKGAGLSLFAKIGLSVVIVAACGAGFAWSRAADEPPPKVASTSPQPSSPAVSNGAGQGIEPKGADLPSEPENPPLNTDLPSRDAQAAPAKQASSPGTSVSGEPSSAKPASTVAPSPSEPSADPVQADSLKEETRLLARAHAALSRGDAAGALVILDEHAAKFPNGVLAPERRAARAMALCKQGRADDGRREAGVLYGADDKSPLAEKIRRACGK